MTQRLMPPIASTNVTGLTVNPFTQGGLNYSCTAGSTIDVREDGGNVEGGYYPHAQTLISNGWIPCSTSGVGPTSQRPPSQSAGSTYIDTTLSKVIIFDGKTWRDPVTGATA